MSCFKALGAMEESLNRSDEAEALFKRALDINPGHVPSLQAMALLCTKQGNYNEARSLLETALKKNPKHLPALHVGSQTCSVWINCVVGLGETRRDLWK